MNRVRIICVVGAMTLFSYMPCFVTTAVAQNPSIWERRDPRMANMFANVTARRAGDLLFVTIDEQSNVQNRDLRTLRKQASSQTDGEVNYGLTGGLGSSSGGASADLETSGKRQYDGNTQFRSERDFTDRFTVQVVDTLPNGNLLISGTRNVSLESDNRTLVLTGVVRSVDVKPDNTISSRMVSSLIIRYETDPNCGAETNFINQGWLGRKLNRFWPY